VSQGINSQFFAVKRNELPEIGLKRLKLYRPKKEEIHPDFFKAYQKISKLNTGILEDFYSLESLDIVMLHNDDVNEEAILFFNWALDLLAKFNKTYYDLLLKDPLLSELANFPIGLEIPSSTLYSISEDENNTLTEIAGLIVYYLNPKTGIVKRDYTLQFHPELFEEIQMFQRIDFETKTLFELTDGIQLLLSCLQAGFIETSKKS